MTERSCRNCTFGVIQHQHQSTYRRCHRHAPTIRTPTSVLEEMIGSQPVWPYVQDTDFCGDFEAGQVN